MPDRCKTHDMECTEAVDCRTCGGDGIVESDDPCEPAYIQCWQCRGSGMSPWLECEMCLLEGDYDD